MFDQFTLEEILDAARRGDRLDPPTYNYGITFFVRGGIKAFNAENFEQLLSIIKQDYGVELRIVGGGAGCLRIICAGASPDELAELISSKRLVRAAADAGIDIVWTPHNRIPVKKFINRDSSNLADFAILVPMLEEFRHVKKALNEASFYSRQIPLRSMTYFEYKIKAECGVEYNVVATYMPRIGNDVAASTTLQILQDWNPKHILLLGIAGGLNPKKVKLGDVIIVDQVLRYDRRRKELDGETQWAPLGYATDRLLLNRAQAFLLQDEKIQSWREEANVDGHSPTVDVRVGNIACGDAVVDSFEHKQMVSMLDRTAEAIEMEAGGFLESILNHYAMTRALVLRGISDYAADKDDTDSDPTVDWRAFAAKNVASFAVRFIKHYELGSGTLKQGRPSRDIQFIPPD